MTPVFQRADDDCFRCCVASVLDWPYEDVPDFMEGSTVTVSTDYMDRWFASHGLVLLRFPIPVATPLQARTMVAASQPPVCYILSGLTKKGVGHAVVCLGSQVAHDPAVPSQPIYAPHETGSFGTFFIGLR